MDFCNQIFAAISWLYQMVALIVAYYTKCSNKFNHHKWKEGRTARSLGSYVNRAKWYQAVYQAKERGRGINIGLKIKWMIVSDPTLWLEMYGGNVSGPEEKCLASDSLTMHCYVTRWVGAISQRGDTRSI